MKLRKEVAKNRVFLTSIMKCIEICDRQGISLRGHRDDTNFNAENQGNFKALIDLCLDAGDIESWLNM